MGISGFTEMTRLSKMVCPDISVITNIGCCHLENLKDRDGVLKAKTEMFQYLKEDGHIVLCGDDDKLSTIKEYNGIKPIFYGIDTDREYYAEDIEDNLLSGIDCVLCHGNVKIPVHIPAPGRHMVENALAAFAVGELLGLTPDEIKRGVESFKNVGSRNNIIDNGSYIVIDDCYNANPTSVKAGLDTLAPVKGRTVAVLGDMKELGTDEISLHFEVGRYAKEKGINLLIAAGPLAKSLAEGYGDGAVYYETVDLACEKIKDLIQPDDTVLVKASHSMHFEKIVLDRFETSILLQRIVSSRAQRGILRFFTSFRMTIGHSPRSDNMYVPSVILRMTPPLSDRGGFAEGSRPFPTIITLH